MVSLIPDPLEKRRLYADIETCGFWKGSSGICEVAASVWYKGSEESSFSSLANPGAGYLQSDRFSKAHAVHSIPGSAILESPPAEDVAASLLAFIKEHAEGASLHSFNVQFDSRHLAARPWCVPLWWWSDCVMMKAREAMKLKKFPKLTEAARFCGLDDVQEHRALSDARLCAMVHHWILRYA